MYIYDLLVWEKEYCFRNKLSSIFHQANVVLNLNRYEFNCMKFYKDFLKADSANVSKWDRKCLGKQKKGRIQVGGSHPPPDSFENCWAFSQHDRCAASFKTFVEEMNSQQKPLWNAPTYAIIFIRTFNNLWAFQYWLHQLSIAVAFIPLCDMGTFDMPVHFFINSVGQHRFFRLSSL